MSLKALQRQWDRFGRADPLWAVLSLPDKRHGRWNESEFFATGRREIDDVLGHARGLGVSVRRERALDFGCGVGRLAQALAPHFERVDGVDIAPSMLEQAARYNRHPACCFFHLNERPDLALFAERAFTFVYTSLVLQHLPAELSRGYIREFLRVLAPDGLLVFHLPSEPFPKGHIGPARRSFASGPLPADAWRARIETETSEIAAAAGDELVLKARVTNLSRHPWPALGAWNARFQVNLGGRFRIPTGELVDGPGARASLPHDLEGGASAELFLRIPIPLRPGDYLLELDLVQEGVAWFKQKCGADVLLLPCRVAGEAGAAGPLRLVPSEPAPQAVPFRLRHPRAHFVLARVLRLPAMLNAVVRASQTAAFQAVMLRFTVRDRVRRLLDPPMPMNGIPRAQVEELIREAGGRLMEVENSELTFAGWQAYRYWVTREVPRQASPVSSAGPSASDRDPKPS